MNISSHYKLRHFIPWTKHHIVKMIILSVIPTVMFFFLDIHWLVIPWVPVALIGTATAFISGFKNTQTYNRTWEARQIYGAIINSSRTFGVMTKDFVRTGNADEDQNLKNEII
jgi:putative membrane protein